MWVSLPSALLIALATIAVGPLLGSAVAAPASVLLRHGPTSFAPGSGGEYVVRVRNLDSTALVGPLTLVIRLPPAVTATSAQDNSAGFAWSCPDVAGARVVTCTSGALITPIPFGQIPARGTSSGVSISVDVDHGASGILEPTATIFDAAGVAVARAVDPTAVDASASAAPGFGIVPGTLDADAYGDDGSPLRQAGAHPFEAQVNFQMNLKRGDAYSGQQYGDPDEHVRTVSVKLPHGFVGNPEATPRCSPARMSVVRQFATACPTSSQVGVIDLVTQDGFVPLVNYGFANIPVYNMMPPRGAVADFAFMIVGRPVHITASLDPSDYSIVATVNYANELYPPRESRLTLWGVPSDPAHDPLRYDTNTGFAPASSNAAQTPFLTLPSECGVDGSTTVALDSWENPGVFTPPTSSQPVSLGGCELQRFDASLNLQPTETRADQPAGLEVNLSIPQDERPRSLGTPPLRKAVVTLPEGMAVSPSSADGLKGCAMSEIKLRTNDAPTCPDGAKIGSVTITTPLLADPLEGEVFLAAQGDNPFRSLLAMYIVARGPGILIKLPGRIDVSQNPERLVTTFDNNPQLPFSNLKLRFKSGPRAPLVTPATCGEKTTVAELTSWNATIPVVRSTSSFTITHDANGNPCGPAGFNPTFEPGSVVTGGAQDTAFTFTMGRNDGEQQLGGIEMTMPKGFLGRIASVPLCSDAQAAAGTCGDESLVGSTTVGAGPGTNPFFITNGRVYITGPYKGAPFGLSIVVPAKAGPFDLGTVVVRSALYVDKRTTALRVVSDDLPTHLEGIPLRVRKVNVLIDRKNFLFNPSNCSRTSITGKIRSSIGTVVDRSAPFQVTDCASLSFLPRMSIRIGRRGHTGREATTPLVVTMTQRGKANIRGVEVQLPTTVNARLPVVNRACTMEAYQSGNCGRGALIGSAVVVTPLLRDPLRGPVYFVRNPPRRLPDMVIGLRGQVDVDLFGIVRIPGGRRLATNFDAVPDVPFTKFTLKLVDGRNGPVGAVNNLCTRRGRAGRAAIIFRAQNGDVIRRGQRLQIVGCSRAARRGRSGARGRARGRRGNR